jgi:multiple sugar transport system substrate-binding protein
MTVKAMTRREVLKSIGVTTAGVLLISGCQLATPMVQVTEPTKPSEPAAEKGPVELTAAWLAPQSYWEPQLKLFNELHPEIRVKPIETPVTGAFSWGAFFDKVATLIAAGVPIDTIRVPIEGAKLVVALGIVQPLDDYLAMDPLDEALSDIEPMLRKPFQLRGKTWAIPWDFNVMMIWYNMAHFKEAGIEPPGRDWTYEEFLEIAGKLTVKSGDQVERFGFVLPTGYHFQSIPWVFNRGASHLSDDWNKATMDDPKFLSGIDFMRDLVWKHKVATVDSDPFRLMYSGKASMVGGGRWPTLTFVRNNFRDGNITVWPDGGARFTEFGVGAQWMTKLTKHPDAVWEVLKFFTTKESQEALHGGAVSISVRRSVATTTTSEFAPPDDKLFYESFDIAPPKPVPSPPDFSRIEEPLMRGYQETVVSNARPTEEVWAEVQEEVSKIIAERPKEWQDL